MNPVDFGTTSMGTPVDQVFTISNSSPSDVALTAGSLSLPQGYSLVGAWPESVPADGSANFTVQLDASSIDTPGGELSFSDSDPGGGFYQFAISGTVVAATGPAMQLFNGSTAIANGGSNSFGSVSQGASDTATFAVENAGMTSLSVSAISLPSGYSLQTTLPLDIAPGGATTFIVALDTSTAGDFSGLMSITDTDVDNNPYNVSLSGTVAAPAAAMQLLDGATTIGNGGSDSFAGVAQGAGDTTTFTVRNNGAASLSVSAVSLPTGYSLQTTLPLEIAAGGSTTFAVALDTSAVGTFSGLMSITDTDGDNNPYTVSLSGAVYGPPVANDDSYSTSHLHPITISAASGVAANDSNPGHATLTVELVAGPQNGTLALNDDGSFVYTPSGTYVGADSFTYQLVAGAAVSNVATVSVQSTNAAPVAVDSSFEVIYGDTFNSPAGGVLANDTDADGDPLTTQLIAGPSHGTLSLNVDGSFTYTPDSGFLGGDSFTYIADDGITQSNVARATLDVSDPNSEAQNDAYSLVHDRVLNVSAPGVLSNDGAPDGPPLTAQLISGPSHGALSLNSDGSFDYTPDAGFVGTDQFTYQEADGVNEGEAVATINVTNYAPIADNVVYESVHDQTLNVSAADGVISGAVDADGDALTALLLTSTADGALTFNADGSFSYVPNVAFVGADSFTFAVSDGAATSDTATVTLNVTDAPPLGNDAEYSIAHDRTLTIGADQGALSVDSDADGDALTAQLVTSTAHGTLALAADGGFVYTPAAGYAGVDQFTYVPDDGIEAGSLTTVTIDVTNAAPITNPISYDMTHDRALDATAAKGVLSVDLDADGDPLTATLATNVADGTLTLNADGSFAYQPAAGFVGVDRFTYTVGDGIAASAPLTATINVTDQAPAPANDVYQMPHDATLTVAALVGVSANDTDAEGDALTVAVYSPPSGTLNLAPDGSFSYSPVAGFHGTVQFTYRDFDGAEWSNPATATIQVDNPPPVAQDDAFSLLHDATLTIGADQGVLANDYSLDGSTLSAVLDATASHGALTLASDGSFTYVPAAGYTGQDSFTYHNVTAYGASSPATVTLTVADQSPTAEDLSYSVPHDQPLVIDAATGALSGALDGDGDALTAELQTAASDGTVTLNADGSFTYVPVAGFLGSDSFTYVADDGAMQSDPGTVTIDVTDAAPTALDQSYAANHDQTLIVSASSGLLAGASDSDLGDTMTAMLIQPANNGTVTLDADGSFNYVPDSHFVGTDSFTFAVTDGLLVSGAATVTLSVVNTSPASTGKSYSTIHDHALTVDAAQGALAGDTDAESDALTATLISGVGDGTLSLNADGSFSYVPLAGFVGVDGFSYRASDGLTTGDVTDVSIEVTNQAPTAGAVSYTVDQGQTLSVSSGNLLSAASDADGDALTAQLLSGPSDGVLSLSADGNFSYTPDAAFSGVDSFTFLADDGLSQSAPATATITVGHAAELPVLSPMSFTVHAGQTLSDDVLSGVSVPNGDALSASVVTQSSQGTLTMNADGSFTYVPAAGFVGSDTFSFEAANGAASTAPIGVTVYVVNSMPAAAAANYSAYLTTPLSVSAAGGALAHATDPDGDALTAAVVSGPSHGTLTLNSDGSFTYTADAGFTGADSFVYSAADPFGAAASATVTIAVSADAVIAGDDAYSVVHDRPLDVGAVNGVLRNDWAVDNGALTAQILTSPAHGSLTLSSDGSFSYLPAAGYVGADSFTYEALEGSAAGLLATVALSVNDAPPVTAPDNYSVSHDHTLTVAVDRGLLANDYSDEGDSLTASVVTAPTDGALTLNPDGSFSYVPNAGFVGADSFTYLAGDGASASPATTVTIDVTDQSPAGQGAAYRVYHGQSLSVAAPGPLAFDYDPDGDPLTLTVTSTTTHGTLAINPDGSFAYTPTPLAGGRDFTGADSFSYTLSDGAMTSNPIIVSLDVWDEAPQANADYYSVQAGAALAANVLANDVDADGDALKAAPVSLPPGVALDAQGNLTAAATLAPGTYTIAYLADDNALYSNSGVVTIDVTDNAPAATPDLFTTQYGQALAGANVLANDFDPDGAGLTAALISPPSHSDGNFSLSAGGDVQYTPAPGFSGADSFTYRASDGILSSAVVTVAINVTEDPPAAVGDFLQTSVNTPVSGNVLANAVNPDGSALTASLAAAPADGTVTLAADGGFTYTPASGYSGSDSFQYTLTDGVSSSTGDVTIIIESWQLQTEDAHYTVDLSAGSLQVAGRACWPTTPPTPQA